MADCDASFEYGDDLSCHWCAPPAEEKWRSWVGSSDGLASQQPMQRGSKWHVWCFCGHEMALETLSEDYFEDLRCHCGRVGETARRTGTLWRCKACSATHKVCDPSTGQPQGVPASPECRALRYQGHALIRCLGTRRAYDTILPEGFHFGSAGIAASIDAVMRLRQAASQQRTRDLSRLADAEADVAALREAVTEIGQEQAEFLLFAYASADRPRLLEVLLQGRVCDVNAQRKKDGCTALHLARYRHREAAARVLLAHGADVAIRNKWGETPEDSARCGST